MKQFVSDTNFFMPKTSNFLAIIVVATLTVASAFAIVHGVADEKVASVNFRLYQLGRENARTGATADAATNADLKRIANQAVILAPRNSQYWEVLARVEADSVGAYAAAQRAVVIQPSSAYAWSGLLQIADRLNAEGRLPSGMARLEQVLQRTATLGRQEPQVLAVITDIGLANWATLGSAAQATTMRSLATLAGIYPDTVIAVGFRRGQLPLVCKLTRLASRKECIIYPR